MGNGMNKVLPGLYVGNFRDAKDQEQLRANNITHIISIHDNAKKVHDDKEYLCIQAADTPGQNLTQFFSRCNDFIHRARSSGGGVLIHCLAGVSRSVTIAAAYLMSVTSLSCKDSLKVLRGARSIANPNCGFQKQLHQFEFQRLTEERRRLRERYPKQTFQLDEVECKKLLVIYHATTKSKEPCGGICRRYGPPPSPKRQSPNRDSPRSS
ncbi:Dual specificity protein phosphatase 22, partial [Stegodyphus mimosarum]